VLVRGAGETEVLRHLLVHQAQRMRQPLRRQDRETAAVPMTREVRRMFTPAVEDEHTRAWKRSGEVGGGGVREMVGSKVNPRRIQPGQGRLQKGGGFTR